MIIILLILFTLLYASMSTARPVVPESTTYEYIRVAFGVVAVALLLYECLFNILQSACTFM